jgi:DNA-binding response OmpR family regulator
MAKILLVDDDQNLVHSLLDFLSSDNHTVETAYNGKDGLQLLQNFEFDLVILDWSMPDMQGIEVLKEFRKEGGRTPIIFLTGMTNMEDKLEGLGSGADDYVTKPFHLRELSARIKAVLRRPKGLLPVSKAVGNLTIVEGTRTVNMDGKTINLGRREFAVLDFLVRHPNRTYSAKDLMKAIWPSDAEASEDAVRVCVNALRKKITSSDGTCVVKTILGSGYIIESEQPEPRADNA